MSNDNRIIFVGPAEIHKAFSEMGQYNFQEPITSLEEFQYEMRLDERDSKVSRNSSVIIFFSSLYIGAEKDFAKLVAFYAPYAVVAILMPDSYRAIMPRMESSIRAAKRGYESYTGGLYNASTPTYFIRYESPIPDLTQAMVDFIADESVGSNAKSAVMEMLPDRYKSNKSTLSIETEFDNDGEIVIPDASAIDGEVISITSSKGGSGESTVSIILVRRFRR